MPEAGALLDGWVSVLAALESGNRPVYEVLADVDKATSGTKRVLETAAARKVKVRRISHAEVAAVAGSKSHGGVVARVGDRRFQALDTLTEGQERPFIAMLEGVEDPFNFGQALRALYAAGAHGLVVRPRNWTAAASVVARASAGASEWMPMALAETALDAAEHFKAEGLTVVLSEAGKDSRSLYEADLRGPLFLVIGGEKRGTSRALKTLADLTLRIPYGRSFGRALDTTSATAVLAFEIMRQRRFGPPTST